MATSGVGHWEESMLPNLVVMESESGTSGTLFTKDVLFSWSAKADLPSYHATHLVSHVDDENKSML